MRSNTYKQTEEDFYELYPECPKIITTPTYIIINLHYFNDIIQVKLPSQSNISIVEYLLHKAIFSHLLNKNCPQINPLVETAKVISYEVIKISSKSKQKIQNLEFLQWYKLYLGIQYLHSGTSIECIIYDEEQKKLQKYRMLCLLQKQKNVEKFLVRNYFDGKFYQINRYANSDKLLQQKLSGTIDLMKDVQHPFIARLRQSFKTKESIYLIFDHTINSLQNILKKTPKISLQNLRTIFLELISGCRYLQSKNISYQSIQLQDLLVSESGHIVIGENVLIQNINLEEYRNATQRRIRKKQSINEIFREIFSRTKQFAKDEQQVILQFLEYAQSIPYKAGSKIFLDFLQEYPWLDESKTEKILNRDYQGIPFNNLFPYQIITDVKTQKMFKNTKFNYDQSFTFMDSYYLKPQARRIIEEYSYMKECSNYIQNRSIVKIPSFKRKQTKTLIKGISSIKDVRHYLQNQYWGLNNNQNARVSAKNNNISPYEQIIKGKINRTSHKKKILI